MLADEAETGALGEIAFEQRTGIDIPQRTNVLAEGIDKGGEARKAFTDDIVIVGKASVASNDPAVRSRIR